MNNDIRKYYLDFVSNYMQDTLSKLNIENVHTLINEIINSKNRKIFLLGAGRSGLEAKGFAMRLMHLEFDVHVIGEVATPPINNGLIIIISGSGETRPVVELVKSIRFECYKLITVTTNENSSLGKMSDLIIKIPIKNNNNNILPMGTIFEAVSHIFLDAIISELMTRLGITEEYMKNRHQLSEYVGLL